jgi:hypothetical protein
MRTDKDNNQFVTFPVNVVIPAKSGINKTIEVSVSMIGTQADCGKYVAGKRVEMLGTLTPRKHGEAMYFNYMASTADIGTDETKDTIEGDIEFRGSLGNKDITVKKDKNGNPYSIFSGFSTEKVGDTFEYIWVRFVRFSSDKESFIVPKGKVNVKGSVTFSVYNDKLDIGCTVSEVTEWVKEPYHGAAKSKPDAESNLPF